MDSQLAPGNQVSVGRDLSEASTLLEHTPSLLDRTRSGLSVWARKYHSRQKCISSKAALLILLWSFIVGLAYGMMYNPITYIGNFIIVLVYAVGAAILCFYPLAGFLADNKFGRYRTVVRSLYVLLVLLTIAIIAAATLIPLMLSSLENDKPLTLKIVFIIMIAFAVLVFFPATASFVCFNVNVIQFGMDQLHDSPGDHQSLFIHWYVWVYYLGLFITELVWGVYWYGDFSYCIISHAYCGDGLLLIIPIMAALLLIVSLCIAHRRRNWFLVDPPRLNPYKLVYRVTKFARQHKVPVRSSAFTYCEDDVPSGLDLGKDKYGGPFTTEQVEDVKVFYGILKILFALGPVFFLDMAADPLLYYYAQHGSLRYDLEEADKAINLFLFQGGLLSPLLIVLYIPFYLCILRPFISNYIPGMLKRIGLGIIVIIMSLIGTFTMDTVTHITDNTTVCMFSPGPDYFSNSTISPPVFQDTSLLTVQRSLSSLSNVLVYVALYEFICSQSPHSMKGLLIGLSFAIRGLFESIAAALVTIPYFKYNSFGFFPSCGMYYYLVNIVVALVVLLVYVCVARRYKYRERDEPCNVRRSVEDYYSKIQQERFYDYLD